MIYRRFLLFCFSLVLNSHVFGMQQQDSLVTGRFSTAGYFAIPGSPRQVFNFNPGWRFHRGEAPGAENPGYNDRSWEVVNVPHGLEVVKENASGMRNYQGPAWYRKSFITPPGSRTRRSLVYFEAVMGKAKLWINGKQVAEHFGGYLPFSADLSAYLKPDGQSNIIALWADNSDDPSYPPGKPQGDLDFTYLGGVYRDVYFIQTNAVHVTHLTESSTIAGGGVYVAVKDVQGRTAKLDVKTEVTNESTSPVNITLRSTLENKQGKKVLQQEQRLTLAPGATQQLLQEMAPKNIRPWHPDTPYLHYIKTEVLVNGKVTDSYRTRFGIRLFEMRGNDGFFVNRRYIGYKLSGVNRHQDYAYVGNALPNSGQWRDAKLLREGGVNIVRAAHYPMDPAFVDACDELGLLLATATPGWQFFNTKDPMFEKRIGEDVRNMARRDRNYASVLLWETALNETDDQTISMMKEQHRITHEEMPYPGIFTVSDVDKAKLAGFDFYYHGAMHEEKCSFTREYGDGGEVENFYSQNAMTRVKREWGEQAMLNQARVRAKGLDGIYGTPPKRIGAAIWCGIDHQRGYHPDPFWGGLLDVFRMPRYSYHLFKSQYDADYKLDGIQTGPMLYIAHELTQASGADVVIFSNCEEVRLTWLGKVIGTAKPDSSQRTMPHAPFIFKNIFNYHEISSQWRNRSDKVEMIAEGIINGQVVCREVKRYPERTTGILLTIEDHGANLSADGSDFIPVRATIIDNKGIPKVLAAEDIHLEVISGDATIIGHNINTINPMKTQFGTATFLLRAGVQPGNIRIRATAEGLKSTEAALVSTASALQLLYTDKAAEPAIPGPVQLQAPSLTNTDIEKMKEENTRLRLQLTSKEQEIMEMRSRINR